MSTVELYRQRVRDWSDALIASDPGLRRLTQAAQIATGLGVSIAVEYGFAQLAHPLWDSAPAGVHLSVTAAVVLAAQHHGVTLIAMLLGGIIAMVTTIAVTDVTPRGQAITMIGMPVPMLGALAISIELAPHRTIGLIGLALVMGLGTYARKFAPRFGPRVILYGVLLFIGYFFGFIAGKELPIGQIYWLAAMLWLAVLVNFALLLIVFNPLAAGTLSRSRHSFAARARGVIAQSAVVLEDAETSSENRTRDARRLARRLVRLNEAAITIDGQLADTRLGMGDGMAQALHDSLFELELSLENLSRGIVWLAGPDSKLDPQLRGRVATWLAGLPAGDTADAAAYEREAAGEQTAGAVLEINNVLFATAAIVVTVGQSLGSWQRGEIPAVDPVDNVDFALAYESPVMLIGGSLAGSTPASGAAFAADATNGVAARLHLDAPAIAAIRMMIAVGAAIAIANAIDGRRFYWAVIAVFIIYMGSNTAGEQVTKAVERVLGTCVGIVLGSLLAHAIGPSSWSIAVILPAMAFGVYFASVSYALMAVGLTITLSMLYVDLGEFSNGLLLDRLELTAIGAAIATLAALLIFPVRTGRVLRQAALRYLDALLALVEGFSELATSTPGAGELPTATSTAATTAPSSAVVASTAITATHAITAIPAVTAPTAATTTSRHLDDTLQQLLVTARPITRNPFHRDEIEQNLQVFVLSAQFARNLAADAGTVNALDTTERAQLTTALQTEADLVRDLHETISRKETGPDTRAFSSAIEPIIGAGRSLVGQGVPRNDPRRRFLRALSNLDDALIQLSRQLVGD